MIVKYLDFTLWGVEELRCIEDNLIGGLLLNLVLIIWVLAGLAGMADNQLSRFYSLMN